MSDETLKNEEVEEDAKKATASTKKASPKKEVVVEPVAQEEAPVVEEAVIVNEEPVTFVYPTASTGTTYNVFGPWVPAQNGDPISWNTNVNTKDWAGAVVFQNGQYNTTQRGF